MKDKLPKKIEKPWGFELLWAHTPQYAGKLIFLKKGHRLSLQYHQKKDETLYLYEGKALFEVEGSDGPPVKSVAEPGYTVRIRPLTRHRVAALEDTILLEVSTPELDDVVRLQDDYGR
jgi:mannose-6-phosphate isomerase-like protein (cupin superfamily)